MLRFICIGEMHYSENPPSYRLDDYFVTQHLKLLEIKEYTAQNHVDAILELGDFLDKAKISSERLAYIFQEWNNRLIDGVTAFGLIPIIGIPGNHELVGGQIDAYEKTSLHLLEVSSFIQMASKENPIIFKDKSGFTVAISGSAYTKDVDNELDKSAYIIDKKSGDIHIHMVHGLLMNKSFGKKFEHTTIHEIAPKTVADITLNGHDHIGYPITELNGKWFANPGSVTRMKAEENEIKRMPKFMVIEIWDDLSIHMKDVYFKCALPGEDVLSRDHINARKKKKNFWADMQARVNDANLQQGGLKISDIIDNVSKAQGLPATITTQAKEYLVDATQAMETPYSPQGAYYIERLELENFQSHERSVFTWDPHLNILAGESSSGKSAVKRALKELYYCDAVQPRDYIKHQASYFQITATLSNGYVVSRKVEKKERGFNGYIVIDPNKGVIEEYKTTGLPYIQEILGIRDIHLSDKSRDDIGVNFSSQGDSWFHESISGPNKAKMLGVPYGTHYADYAVRNCNSEVKRKTTELNLHKKDLEALERQETKFANLPQLESSIADALAKFKIIQEMEERLHKLKLLRDELRTLRATITKKESDVAKLSVDFMTPYNALMATHTHTTHLKQLSSDMKAIVARGKKARAVQNVLNAIDIVALEQKHKMIMTKEQDLRQLKEKQQKLAQIQRSMQAISKRIGYLEICAKRLAVIPNLESMVNQLTAKYKMLELAALGAMLNTKQQAADRLANALSAMSHYSELQEMQGNCNRAKQIATEMKTTAGKMRVLEKQLTEHESEINQLKDAYAEKLSQSSQCPICHTAINEAVISKIIQEL